MKKIFYSILLSGMMVLSACDALDLSPEDYYGSNDFWNQKSQVEMFMGEIILFGTGLWLACILLFLSLSNIWWCAVRDGTESYRG